MAAEAKDALAQSNQVLAAGNVHLALAKESGQEIVNAVRVSDEIAGKIIALVISISADIKGCDEAAASAKDHFRVAISEQAAADIDDKTTDGCSFLDNTTRAFETLLKVEQHISDVKSSIFDDVAPESLRDIQGCFEAALPHAENLLTNLGEAERLHIASITAASEYAAQL